MNRRVFMICTVAALMSPAALGGEPIPTMDVYKSATCGCCGRWADQMRAAGFEVRVHDVIDVAAERKRLGMPDGVAGCHTAVVSGGFRSQPGTRTGSQRSLSRVLEFGSF